MLWNWSKVEGKIKQIDRPITIESGSRRLPFGSGLSMKENEWRRMEKDQQRSKKAQHQVWRREERQ